MTGMVTAPAKNDSLVRNGTVISDLYFYGVSPPVYPSPLGNGTGDWADAYTSARALVAQMTMNEKVSCSESLPFYQN
jgi:beta-glucosidase